MTPIRIGPTRLHARATRVALAVASGALIPSPVTAKQGLRVDINHSGRPVAEGLDPSYIPWSTDSNWLPDGNQTTATFGPLTVTISRVGPVGSGLRSGYWKEGVQRRDRDLKLIADGIQVDEGDAGAQLEMRIAGLTPGTHTLLLHLNSWDAPEEPAPLGIRVDGQPLVEDLEVSVRAIDRREATRAYLPIVAGEGRDVIVRITAADHGPARYRNVHLNGFEIDTPDDRAQADRPSPADGEEHADADDGTLMLTWRSAVLGAASHDVYIGRRREAVAGATRGSPEFRGNQTDNHHVLPNPDPHANYFWRVDAVDPAGRVTPGAVWRFRVRRLAFPGAEGYGRFARGGRGGVVVRVTNLNDRGPGSFRDAVEGDHGPRTIVFDVGGLITLESDLVVTGDQPGLTIAGQTAPGKGICIRRHLFGLSGATDCVVRFLRVFVGEQSGETQNATGMAGVDHSIMDHCSFGWAQDEAFSSRGAWNLTLQRCLIAEMLNVAGHDKYPPGTAHGYAASIGGNTGSFHHNLLAHNEGRNWSLAGGLDGAGRFDGRLDLFNNVVYNWGSRTTDGGARQVNFVNNYYKPGPATRHYLALTAEYDNFPGRQQYHMSGNVMPGQFDEDTQDKGRTRKGHLPTTYETWIDSPLFPSHATVHTAGNAYKQVLSDVGCNQPCPDRHNIRIIGETLAGTHTYSGSVSGKPGLPDHTDDVGGWEDYGHPVRPADWDRDGDGMPAWWERVHGLDPDSPKGDFSEGNADPDGDGYTQLEDYLNWMADPHFDCLARSSVDIDLHDLSRGYFATGPTFRLGDADGGTVALIAGRHARFTPSASNEALGGFRFTVTDTDGDSMSRHVRIRVLAPPEAPATDDRKR